jgi:hypothetical protein
MKNLIPVAAGMSGILIAALFASAQPAYSKTPDGKTPAEETVCDPLHEATPGLYGLCVAFCEAHDADLVDPAALTRPDLRILENYDRKRRDGDPPMPCLIQPPEDDGPTGSGPPIGFCPCWSAEALDVMLPPTSNFDDPVNGACANGSNAQALYNHENGSSGPGFDLVLFVTVSPAGEILANEGCDVIKFNGYVGGAQAGTNFGMSQDEAEACSALLANHARKYSGSNAPGLWSCFDGQ